MERWVGDRAAALIQVLKKFEGGEGCDRRMAVGRRIIFVVRGVCGHGVEGARVRQPASTTPTRIVQNRRIKRPCQIQPNMITTHFPILV